MIFRGQIQRIHDYMLHITVAVVIFIIGFVLVYNILPKPQFSYSAFIRQQAEFKRCIGNEELFLSANHFNEEYRQLPLETLSLQYKALTAKIPSNCGALHAESSYEQLLEMAIPVLAAAQKFYKSEDVKAVNAVYTMPSRYSALLDKPQPYLFFISNKDQDRIVAIKVSPTETDVLIELLWDFKESTDLAYTQGQVQKLLLVYKEIKN